MVEGNAANVKHGAIRWCSMFSGPPIGPEDLLQRFQWCFVLSGGRIFFLSHLQKCTLFVFMCTGPKTCRLLDKYLGLSV